MTDNRRRALVTAGRTGIGAAVADALRREGCDVWVTSRVPGQEDPRQLLLDASASAGEVARVVDIARPDIVVHCAAHFPPFARVESADPVELVRALEVKVLFGHALVRAALPYLRSGGAGRVVWIGSAAGEYGAVGQSAYSAANSALTGLARSLAIEEGRHGITVNVVVPGLVETARLKREVSPAIRERIVERTAVGRSGSPEEVADVVAFVSSAECGYVTGAVIPVDGGLGLGIGTG